MSTGKIHIFYFIFTAESIILYICVRVFLLKQKRKPQYVKTTRKCSQSLVEYYNDNAILCLKTIILQFDRTFPFFTGQS